MRHYGGDSPPEVPLKELKIPVALISGSSDLISTNSDVDWLSSQLGQNVIYNRTFNLGHLSFTLANDMSWFSKDVIDIIAQYATNRLV